MVKYIFLYNICDDNINTMQMINKIKKVIPSTKILNYSLFNIKNKIDCDYSGKSIWIPEQYYMIAITIANYEDLLDIGFYDWESDVTADNLVEWFKIHRNNDNYVKYDLQ